MTTIFKMSHYLATTFCSSRRAKDLVDIRTKSTTQPNLGVANPSAVLVERPTSGQQIYLGAIPNIPYEQSGIEVRAVCTSRLKGPLSTIMVRSAFS